MFQLYGLFCMSERIKTWGYGREQAFLSGQIFRALVLVGI